MTPAFFHGLAAIFELLTKTFCMSFIGANFSSDERQTLASYPTA